MGGKSRLKSSDTGEKHGFRDRQDVKSYLKDHSEITHIRVVYPDILGVLRDQMFPIIGDGNRLDILEGFFDKGDKIDGSSVTGFREDVNESDLRFMPEVSTFMPLPWVYRGKTEAYIGNSKKPAYPVWREALFFGHILTPEGEHFEGDSRHVLKSLLERKKGDLFTDFKVGPEFEFYFFFDEDKPTITDSGEYHTGGKFGEIRKEMQILFPGLGWECDHHEVGPGQHELDLKYDNAMDMADKVALIRYALKRIAKPYGIHASFMPKPLNDIPGKKIKNAGSGMHVNQSLWRGNRNLFSSKRAEFGLSKLAKKYLTGLIANGRPLALLCNQYVNSYKRLVPNHEAPTKMVWGSQNRSAYIRIPEDIRVNPRAARVELRSPDPSLNPWLGFAGMLAAGMDGIERDMYVPNPVPENVFKTDDETAQRAMYGDRKERYRWELPANLGEAIECFRESDVMREALGEHVMAELIRNKTHEWKEFNEYVTDYEISHYLSKL